MRLTPRCGDRITGSIARRRRFRGAAIALAGCGEGLLDGGDPASREVRPFSTNGVTGQALRQVVLERAAGIAPHNRPYVFDGVQDCYGYVRQVWNAILYDGSKHVEDFYPNSYDRSRWLGVSDGLPGDDHPSSNWVYFSDPNVLLPGDVLATHQGHAWGANWHGGIYAGVGNGQHRQWDNTTYGGDGAYNRRRSATRGQRLVISCEELWKGLWTSSVDGAGSCGRRAP